MLINAHREERRVHVGAGSFDLCFQVSNGTSVTGLPSSSPTASSSVVKFAKGAFNQQLRCDLSRHLVVISA